jgi:hypothetical protein
MEGAIVAQQWYWVHFSVTLSNQPVPVTIENGVPVMAERITEPAGVAMLAAVIHEVIRKQHGCQPEQIDNIKIFGFHPLESPLILPGRLN